MKVIILNGPPGCGKDTLADHLVYSPGALRNAEKREFKTHLFRVAATLAAIPLHEMITLNAQKTKNTPCPSLPGNKSPREWLIYVSENVVKPHLGSTYFGATAAKTLNNEDMAYVFADGGFDVEVAVLAEKVGKNNVLVLQITRPGHSFAEDSRRYITTGIAGTTLGIANDHDEERYLREATKMVSIWLNS